MFIPSKQNLILKNGEKKSVSYEMKASIIYPNKENVFVVPNHKKKGDYIRIHICPIVRQTLILRKIMEGEAFRTKPTL